MFCIFEDCHTARDWATEPQSSDSHDSKHDVDSTSIFEFALCLGFVLTVLASDLSNWYAPLWIAILVEIRPFKRKHWLLLLINYDGLSYLWILLTSKEGLSQGDRLLLSFSLLRRGIAFFH